MPVITTLHTVLREPDLDQRVVMHEIAARSERLIVMSSTLLAYPSGCLQGAGREDRTDSSWDPRSAF